MRKPITKRAVDAIKPGELLADTLVQGFVARRLPSGVVTYGFRYRQKPTGRRRWIALGLHGQVTPDEARTLAKKHAGGVADGGDPLGAQEQDRAKANAAKTVADILDQFIADYARPRQLRTTHDTEVLFTLHVKPTIGAMLIPDLRRSHIVALLDSVTEKGGPTLADRTLAHLRRALNWYEAAGKDDEFRSPIVRGMAKTSPRERARDRVLSDDEIRQVWAALGHVHPVFSAIVRVLFLTAQRRDEIAAMRWDEISDSMLIIPAGRYKTKSENVVPLTPSAVTILEAQPTRDRCEYVFSTNDRTPFSGFSKSKASLDRAIQVARKKAGIKSPMPSWRLHDLRRTARTIMSRAGVPSDTAERVLGHRIQGVRRTYDRHDYIAEKRDALTKLGAIVARILNSAEENAVLPAPGRKVPLDAASDKQRAGLADASQRAEEEPERPSDLGQH